MVNAVQILMEGGPISMTDVEKELGIPHNTFIFHLKKIGPVSFVEGMKNYTLSLDMM